MLNLDTIHISCVLFSLPVEWCHGVVVIVTVKFHSTKSEIRFCAGSNPAASVLGICDGENLWQWSPLEIRLNAFHKLNIPQKQFIIMMMITNSLSHFSLRLFAFESDRLHYEWEREHRANVTWKHEENSSLSRSLFALL